MFWKAVKILSAASLALVLLLAVFGSNVSAQESPLPTPTEAPDLCPNIPETQTEVPQGYFINNDGQCVPVESPSPNPCDGEFCSPTPSESPNPTLDPCVENQNCPSSTPEPTPTTPTCSSDQHLDASGLRCVNWEQSGGDNGGGGSSTTSSGGSVLGASTVLGAAGNTENIAGLALMIIGLSVTSVSIYAYSQNKYR